MVAQRDTRRAMTVDQWRELQRTSYDCKSTHEYGPGALIYLDSIAVRLPVGSLPAHAGTAIKRATRGGVDISLGMVWPYPICTVTAISTAARWCDAPATGCLACVYFVYAPCALRPYDRLLATRSAVTNSGSTTDDCRPTRAACHAATASTMV